MDETPEEWEARNADRIRELREHYDTHSTANEMEGGVWETDTYPTPAEQNRAIIARIANRTDGSNLSGEELQREIAAWKAERDARADRIAELEEFRRGLAEHRAGGGHDQRHGQQDHGHVDRDAAGSQRDDSEDQRQDSEHKHDHGDLRRVPKFCR